MPTFLIAFVCAVEDLDFLDTPKGYPSLVCRIFFRIKMGNAKSEAAVIAGICVHSVVVTSCLRSASISGLS